MTRIPQVRVYTGTKAWDVIWKWNWFVGDQSLDEEEARALHPVLKRLNVKTLLDCSCGLGETTVALAALGYRVDGSDASGTAIKCATELAASP